MLSIGSLFSGIGGLELGLERGIPGASVAWQVEINPFGRSILAKHWPEVTRHEDVRSVGSHNLERVDLLCGGFPCQDVSTAGLGAGLGGTRSGLWREYRRVAEELTPPWVVVENVASGARRWLPHVRRDLRLLGYRTRAFTLSAADVGAPHLRRRVFVVAHAERVRLRIEQGGRGGAHGKGAPIPANNGETWDVADTRGARLERANLGEQEQSILTGSNNWWSVEPDVGRVAHGVPSRVDRLKALGNAVVPQCAEVIGRIIAEAIRPA